MFTDATFTQGYENWLDKLAQNAPEGVRMEQTAFKVGDRVKVLSNYEMGVEDAPKPGDIGSVVEVWKSYVMVQFPEDIDGESWKLRNNQIAFVGEAASEPQPNAAEADRKTQIDALQADVLGKRINRIEAIKRYRVIAGEPSIETALEVVKQMEAGRLTWEQQHDKIEAQAAEIERLQAENKAFKTALEHFHEAGRAYIESNSRRESDAQVVFGINRIDDNGEMIEARITVGALRQAYRLTK